MLIVIHDPRLFPFADQVVLIGTKHHRREEHRPCETTHEFAKERLAVSRNTDRLVAICSVLIPVAACFTAIPAMRPGQPAICRQVDDAPKEDRWPDGRAGVSSLATVRSTIATAVMGVVDMVS